MGAIYISWAVSAILLIALAGLLARYMKPPHNVLGILIDSRGRYSLTHFQLVTWSIVILSLVSGIFWGRVFEGVTDPLSFKIPEEVLGLLGISVGSAMTAGAIKASKDTARPLSVAASGAADPPRLSQIFMLEEGEFADKVIDVAKYQNFIITFVLVAAYIAVAIAKLEDAGSPGNVMSLPGFSSTFLVLVGISHAGYLGGKLANPAGFPQGLTVANRAEVAAGPPAGFQARNAAQ